ncbi:MAG TPA: hypothetical protein PLD49_00440 [Thermoclostridium caenicola]|uniref:Uncharacterized protein n=1 Tax=Thermoclostridium caenicola TaxID=659425 RepID=A0A1M6F2U6_9FIRM|nr:hypothetical protein [Thermoclostridium caenicola]SHI91991.1 hypothetical protein SAMN05444373_10159 [Thermoclostridium caenicola]HOK42122.1 hypothetical protein [Thermoclostridium caenicola]HOL84021.1 hypothetical protein [Thermoclostridium caenicola]HPO75603.1 hypothetical protein [Thermoclostridium caenicola]HPU22169.1 hypothetical protein [Thermoclostridium caenicola]
MRIVFLGSHTESKKVLLLSIARILASAYSVRIYSACRYGYDEDHGDVYDFCGTEVRQFHNGEQLEQLLQTNPCDYALIDTELALNAGRDVKLVSLLKAERSAFEHTVEQTRALLQQYPYTDIHIIYYDIYEYCRVSPGFLEKLYYRRMYDAVNVTWNHVLYFEEGNAAAFMESLYEEKLHIRRFSPVWKAQVLNILNSLTGIELKQLKECLKKAERMK